ncbi:hypothetical protein [Vibrio salinus]|uniref:hypothetical protein n=1 Tax=Vibrio salinus TaxID=2899784 RepID=UPI001E3E0A54|nr:hypothetical protein [Vibrio salinus]MCE0495787.1 hypothetical protein [Vibrio salinus]
MSICVMDTNIELVIEIAKRITTKIPDLIYLFSGIVFEAESEANKLNNKGTIESIKWLCHESSYINELDCDYKSRELLEKMMMSELSKL